MNSYTDPTGVRVLSVRVKAAKFLKVDFTFGFLDCKNMVDFKEAADVSPPLVPQTCLCGDLYSSRVI